MDELFRAKSLKILGGKVLNGNIDER